MNYLQVKSRIIKLNAYYAFNKGENMNKYTTASSQLEGDKSNDIKVFTDSLIKFLKYRDIFQLSSFEMEEMGRVKNIIDKKSASYLKESDATLDILKLTDNIIDYIVFAFDSDKNNEYDNLRRKIDSYNKMLIFELKSLQLQKEHAMNNFEISRIVKINEKINDVNEKMRKQKEKIDDINSDILEQEISFFNKYLAMLNDIVKGHLKIDAKNKLPKNYEKSVVDYFCACKLLHYIESIGNEISIEDIIAVLYYQEVKEYLVDVFDYIIRELKNVGANN